MSSSGPAPSAPAAPVMGAPGTNTPIIIGGVVFLLIVLIAAYYYTKTPTETPVTAMDTSSVMAASAVVAPTPVASAPAPATPSTLNTSAAYIGPANGSDYPGNDVGNWSNADPNFCADKCNNTPGCIGFIVSTTGQGCYAKSKFENPVASATSNAYTKPDVILPNAAAKYQAPITGHYTGNELGTFANIDPNFCATKCNATQGCVAFETDTANCTTKSQLTEPLDSSKTGFKVYKKPGVAAVAAPVPVPGAAPAAGATPAYAVGLGPQWRNASVPERFYLKNISTGKFVFADESGKIGEGASASPITADKPADLYSAFGNSANFKRLAIGPGYMRHSGFFMFAQPYTPNNYDFAWEVFTNGPQFMLWNPYPGSGSGHWVTLDPNGRLKIQPTWTGAAAYQVIGINTPSVPVYSEPVAEVAVKKVAEVADNTLAMGASLLPGQFITSNNGQYKFTYQTDANIVLYRVSGGAALWAMQTVNGAWGYAPGRLIMQTDGNLVAYDSGGGAKWASNTWNKGVAPYRLVMQNDGNVVVYDGNNTATWATNTVQGFLSWFFK